MKRIEGGFPERKALALTTLSWIYHAKRTLSVDELLQALALDPSTWQFNHEDVPSRDIIIDACMGLVAIDSENTTARFAHNSVREYFQREANYRRWFPHARQDIAKACFAFLGRETFDCGENPSSDAIAEFQKLYPLLTYAACFWGDHAREGYHQDMNDLALGFLGSKGQLRVAAMVIDAECKGRKYWGTSAPISTSPNLAVQLAARFGALEVLQLLIAQGADLRLPDAVGRTALHWAARGGFLDVVLAVVQRRGVDVDPRCAGDRTPLHWAAKHGHAAVVRALMDHAADPTAESADGRTALHWAASQGHKGLVQLLLDDGRVDAAARSRKGWTALHWAACGGKRAIAVRGVEEHDEEHDEEDGEEDDEKTDAAEPVVVSGGGGDGHGHEEAAALLLQAGVSPRAQTTDGQMAIHWAAASGQTNLVRVLIESGGAAGLLDVHGIAPWHLALESKAGGDAVALLAPAAA